MSKGTGQIYLLVVIMVAYLVFTLIIFLSSHLEEIQHGCVSCAQKSGDSLITTVSTMAVLIVGLRMFVVVRRVEDTFGLTQELKYVVLVFYPLGVVFVVVSAVVKSANPGINSSGNPFLFLREACFFMLFCFVCPFQVYWAIQEEVKGSARLQSCPARRGPS